MRDETFSWYKSANAITPEELAQHPWTGIGQKKLCRISSKLDSFTVAIIMKRTIKGEEWHVNINNII